MDSLTSWAKKKMSSKYWCHGEKRPQRLDLSWTIYDLSFDLKVSEVWHFKGTVCAVILRCCKPKSDQKCRSYVTLKHQWILNLQFDHFFRGLKRVFFWQNQVLPMAPGDGPRWSWVVLSKKLQIHDIQLQKCGQIPCFGSIKRVLIPVLWELLFKCKTCRLSPKFL